VGFVGDDDDVATRAELGHFGALGFGEEFLDGGEDHAAAGDFEQLAEGLAVGSLHGRLAEEFLAALELAVELVVEVVADCEDNDGGVLHRGFADDAGGVEQHRKTFAGALGVPDNTGAAVAGFLAGADGFGGGGFDCVELVVAGDDFEELVAVGVFFEDTFGTRDNEVGNRTAKKRLQA